MKWARWTCDWNCKLKLCQGKLCIKWTLNCITSNCLLHVSCTRSCQFFCFLGSSSCDDRSSSALLSPPYIYCKRMASLLRIKVLWSRDQEEGPFAGKVYISSWRKKIHLIPVLLFASCIVLLFASCIVLLFSDYFVRDRNLDMSCSTLSSIFSFLASRSFYLCYKSLQDAARINKNI